MPQTAFNRVISFVDYINNKHKTIDFSFETEKDEQMPFLDVNVFPENGKFMTNVYRKETFTAIVFT